MQYVSLNNITPAASDTIWSCLLQLYLWHVNYSPVVWGSVSVFRNSKARYSR